MKDKHENGLRRFEIIEAFLDKINAGLEKDKGRVERLTAALIRVIEEEAKTDLHPGVVFAAVAGLTSHTAAKAAMMWLECDHDDCRRRTARNLVEGFFLASDHYAQGCEMHDGSLH
jgi:hypothetical protein